MALQVPPQRAESTPLSLYSHSKCTHGHTVPDAPSPPLSPLNPHSFGHPPLLAGIPLSAHSPPLLGNGLCSPPS